MQFGKQYDAGNYELVVIGAGHAGCEAALIGARMGMRTLLLTISLDSVAFMPCNPSIGGTGKGHLVREIDALGGEMGINIDETLIQSRMLNTSKGPAVFSLRAQADKQKYQNRMKQVIESQENLDLKQNEVIHIEIENGVVQGVLCKTGAYYHTNAAIMATGTYLGGKIFIGDMHYDGGPNEMRAAMYLTERLEANGIHFRRFKTGTPARVHSDTIDYSKMEIQHGDQPIVPFSFLTDSIEREQVPCYLAYTNLETHGIIKDNIGRSPLYTGAIQSTGPRYCPSIEDKVVRFADKERHQLFIEPESLGTKEMYVQGLSSSMPSEVYMAFLRSIPGLEKAEVMREAYAIEYDCIDPTDLKPSLERKDVSGLYFAGQVNGSSGYEEAAAQGLIAGINAVLQIKNEEALVLDRSEAYIGVLIDDLVTKGTNEPYRMMTSRCEYRLTLRQDNADLRLTRKGYEVGSVSGLRFERFVQKEEAIERELDRLKTIMVTPTEENNQKMVEIGSSALKTGLTFSQVLKRPECNYISLQVFDPERLELAAEITQQVEIQVKYEGYIQKQQRQIEQFKRLERKLLLETIPYQEIQGLRIEAQQKLAAMKPRSVGQASRISGVSPADINVLLVYLEQERRKKGQS